MIDIFKTNALGVCKKVQLDEKTAFTFHELKPGSEFRNRNLSDNFIFFVLDGAMKINSNQYEDCRIGTEQMILLVRSSAVHVKVLKPTSLFVMYFDTFLSSCDQLLFNAYLPDTERNRCDCMPIDIPQSVTLFLKQIQVMLAQKVNCMHFHSLKHREFFILMRHFCPREDLVLFLSPLIGRSLHFRNKVLEKYSQMKSGYVMELASLVGMGRKAFDKHFQKEFGTSPAKWLLQEKAKRLHIFLREPNVTIADAMDRFNFNSSSHFNRFCQKHYNMTPGMIIKEANQKKVKDD